MSSVGLARIAAQAEMLRLRALVRRHALRGVFGAVAVVFLLAALVGAHVAGVMALAEHLSLMHAVLIVAGIDLLVALVLASLAIRDVPGEVEMQALSVRQAAVERAIETVALAVLVRRLLRARSWRDVFGVATSTVAAWLFGQADRQRRLR